MYIEKKLIEESLISEFNLFYFSWASIQLFLLVNWFGKKSFIKLHKNIWFVKFFNLDLGYEDIQNKISLHVLLHLSRNFFKRIRTKGRFLNLCSTWWEFRCCLLHQRLLFHPSHILKFEIYDCIKKLNKFNLNRIDKSGKLNSLWLIEQAWFYLEHWLYEKSEFFFLEAAKSNSLEYKKTGKLGKRTKFQKKSTAQLIILVESKNMIEFEEIPSWIPPTVKFKDEILLEHIVLDNEHSKKILNSIDRCILLGFTCLFHRKNEIIRLDQNIQFSYSELILFKPTNWCIQMKTLLLRSLGEMFERQKIILTLEQFEKILTYYEKLPSPSKCLDYVFPSHMDNKDLVYKDLGRLYFKMKLYQSALIVFEYLGNLTKCCICLIELKQINETQKIIQKKLKENPTPFLYCLLGDLTIDKICYEIAWELSDHTYAKSQRSLGDWYFFRKKWNECLKYYYQALKINRFYPQGFEYLSHAFIQLKHFEEASYALTNLVGIKQDEFKLWNNLAATNCYLKKWPQAMHSLEQALRINHDSWQIWENYVTVSLYLEDVQKMLKGCLELVNLQSNIKIQKENFFLEYKFNNHAPPMMHDILSLLAHILILSQRFDFSYFLIKKFKILIRKINVQYKASSIFWNIFAQFYTQLEKPTNALEFRSKQYRKLLRINETKMKQNYGHVGICILEILFLYLHNPIKKDLLLYKRLFLQFKKKFKDISLAIINKMLRQFQILIETNCELFWN